MTTSTTTRQEFGQTVLGPILAEFAMRLWTFLSAAEDRDDTRLLFCARGGLRLGLTYQRLLAVAGLEEPVLQRPFMVSRVAAVRLALAAGCPSAYEQIGYELGGATLPEALRAIGGPGPLDGVAEGPYGEAAFRSYLASEAGQPAWARIVDQAGLLREHLAACLGGASRAVLCDTGLSGSTMQLLKDAVPEVHWGCVLFARANYKRLSTQHFSRTFGLSVQADAYSPMDARSAILRHWHLLETTLEPSLPSVSWFSRAGDDVRSNLEIDGWQCRVEPGADELFASVLDYIDGLRGEPAAARILADVPQAYARLRRSLTWPSVTDGRLLDLGPRSLDFGQTDKMSGRVCEPSLRRALRGSLWREGAVALAAPRLRWPLLAAIEAVHTARWASRSVRRHWRTEATRRS